MKFIKFFGILIPLLSLLMILQSCKESGKQPNIVFFFVDDMGWQDTSVPFYHEKTTLNDSYYTPNMEKLASAGMKFTQAYAYAVCSPSRVSLMTGMNGARHQVTNWTLRKGVSPDPKNRKIEPPQWNMNGLCIDCEEELTIKTTTLPMLLKNAGYKTIHVGKAHFGAKGTPGENPLNLGFDINIAGHAAGGPGSYLGKYNFSAEWRNGDRIWDVTGLEHYHGQDIFLTEALTIEAIKAIDVALQEKKPFYLYMSHYAIHAPWEVDDRYYQKYKDKGLSDFDATYAAMIEGMDKSLGDLVNYLETKGVIDNTLIVFMSDNGQPSQAALNKPLRGHKLTPYEGGVRVPLIVRWNGIVKPGITNSEDYLMIDDIFPTFLEAAGLNQEKGDFISFDGISFLPLLKGNHSPIENRPLFWHFPHTYDQFPYSSIRKGDWKLIYHHTDQSFELFNLQEDISESNNQVSKKPELADELAKELSIFLKETNAGMPVDIESGNIIPYPDEI
ncbi:sulfatase [Bacteroidota bacterium]